MYIVMEYCSGGDLGSLIRKYRMLDEDTAKKFLQQLGEWAACLSFSNNIFLSLSSEIFKGEKCGPYGPEAAEHSIVLRILSMSEISR